MRILTFVIVLIVLAQAAPPAFAQKKGPITVREYFMLLPEKYFYLEMCLEENRSLCQSARVKYLQRFLEVEDNEAGFLRASGDGAQDRITMRLFKGTAANDLLLIYVFGEDLSYYHFLRYKKGKWIEASKTLFPQFKKRYVYEIPEKGSEIAVFDQATYDSKTGIETSGKKLYNLTWNGQKLMVKSVK